MAERTRVAVLLERYQPGRSARSIAASAGIPPELLDLWLDVGTAEPPAEPVPVEVMTRVAAATGAELAVVSRAFTGTWFDVNGWVWNHFRTGDRVILFDAPDPRTQACEVRYGTVLDVDPLDIIEIGLEDGTRYTRTPESDGSIHHVAGGCSCVTPVENERSG
ncbi:hypothetical protein AB0N89_20230 [Amycolatopsis sp. NPDC089917]|uniref:hypothetical protein n=1 Tax=Amycolatopsis sp. NPDC089917 TaxID=3155187 RepID=UPI0034220015